ncbi:hypothetical protein DL771_005832 [Monosporascus sp. 5C6A]|nr:hypothetical protein DL771_005832 [Monosporascus sp. 5C6A]
MARNSEASSPADPGSVDHQLSIPSTQPQIRRIADSLGLPSLSEVECPTEDNSRLIWDRPQSYSDSTQIARDEALFDFTQVPGQSEPTWHNPYDTPIIEATTGPTYHDQSSQLPLADDTTLDMMPVDDPVLHDPVFRLPEADNTALDMMAVNDDALLHDPLFQRHVDNAALDMDIVLHDQFSQLPVADDTVFHDQLFQQPVADNTASDWYRFRGFAWDSSRPAL